MIIGLARSILIAAFFWFWFTYTDDIDVFIYRSTGLSIRAAIWFTRLVVGFGLLWFVLEWCGVLRLKRTRFFAIVLSALTVILFLTLSVGDKQIIRGQLYPSWLLALPFLAIITAWLLPQQRSFWTAPKWLVVVLGMAATTTPFILHPPSLWPGIMVVDSDVNKAVFYEWLTTNDQGIDPTLPNQLIAFYSPSCKFCRYTSYKVDGFLRDHDIPTTVVFPGRFDDASPYFKQKGIRELPTIAASPKTLFTISNKRVPLILHLQYAEIKGVYRYNTFDDRRIKKLLHP